jgi:hypothetical protein
MRTESIEEADDVRDEMRYLFVDLIGWNHSAWPKVEICQLRKTISETPNRFVRAAIHDEMDILQEAIASRDQHVYLTTKSKAWLAMRARELREAIGSPTKDPMERILWEPYYSISGPVRKAELRADVSSLEAALSKLGDSQRAPADIARLDQLRERFKTFEENGERYKLINELGSVDYRLSAAKEHLAAFVAATESVAPMENAENTATVERLRKRFKAFEEDEDPIRGKMQCSACSFWNSW